MTIKDGVEQCKVVGEFSCLVNEAISINLSITELYYRKLSLAKEIKAEYDAGIKWSAAGVKAIESGRADVEDARRMIRETLALEERALAKCREMVSMDDEVIAYRKRGVEIAGRLDCIYGDLIEYYPRAIEGAKAGVLESIETLRKEKAEQKELKAELKNAEKSGNEKNIEDIRRRLESCETFMGITKSEIKNRKDIVKKYPKALKELVEENERICSRQQEAEEKLAEAEKEKRMDELRMAEPAARIEELKAKWDFL